MASYIENLGLEFLVEDEEKAHCLSAVIAEQGKAITGYYGLPYLNKHFGNPQFIMRTRWNEEENRLEMAGVDTHCAGSCVWTVRVSGMNLNPEDADKTEKRIVAAKPHVNGGMAPINIVNADVLPSYMENDIIKLQVIGFPVAFDYFENEEAYKESVTEEYKGGKLLLAEGHIFPSGMLKNHNPVSDTFGQNNWMDDHVLIRGTVKRIAVGPTKFDTGSVDTFICCVIDTEFGELEIIHSYWQVKEEQRKRMGVGATISGVFVLSGDPAIYEYDKGIVLDEDNNFRLLRSTFAGGDPDRLRGALASDAVYIPEFNNQTYNGPDAIIDRFKWVQESPDKFFAHLATICDIDDGEEELAYDVGTRCIVIAKNRADNYRTIAFMDMDEEGRIACIRTSENSRYHFQIDESWKPEVEECDEEDEAEELSIPDILSRYGNYATCELFVDDYNKIPKEDWIAVNNPREGSNGFFNETYYDTEEHDLEKAGMCLSVTELFGNRSLISLKDAAGRRRYMAVEGAVDAKETDFVLTDEFRNCIPGVHLTSGLVFQGRTAIRHYISRWLFLDVYLILSFEIVYGKHQASLTVVGDSGAMCENILKAQLHKEEIKVKTALERFERFRKNKAMQAIEDSDPQSDIRYNALKTIANCYQTGHFDALHPLLANDCVLSSQRRFDSENGSEAVMAYYEKKGKALRESDSYPVCTIVELVGNVGPSVPGSTRKNSKEKTASTVRLMYTGGKLCLYMEQIIDDQKNDCILDLTLDTDGLISQIDLCMPGLFRFAPYKKQDTVSDFEATK